jgi:hypothetical protein
VVAQDGQDDDEDVGEGYVQDRVRAVGCVVR